ncbi:MAG TPA: beta-galactosidase [Chryseosolibacter sp.]|nr:beta-galactosidase [Chryseosolibacter sp.]
MNTWKLNGPERSRRSFLKHFAVTTATFAATDFSLLAAPPFTGKIDDDQADQSQIPWYRRVTRWGQINITEIDPTRYDIPWWRQFWKETGTQGVVVNAGGIVAYYPTRIPLHRQAQYLNDRDLFGELCRAAHDDGVAVFARMDSNRAHEEFYQAHPDWFAIDESGNPYKAGELYVSCINSPYYTEHIPAVLTEIAHMYKPEGFTDNSWSGLGRGSICYCENCKKSFRDKTGYAIPTVKDWDDMAYKKWILWNYDRRLEIWDLNNKTTKAAGGQHCIWAGMNSGSISGQSRSFRDYKRICERADMIMLDDQSRHNESGFQRNGQIGKMIHGLLGWDKLIPESMAMYQAGRPTFRLTSKPVNEARMWAIEGMAGGIQPWWHMVSAYHEDRRMYKTVAPLLQWHKSNEEFLINRQPVATVGVVWSQQNTDFYGRDNAEERVDLPWRGMTEALIRANIPYLPVQADHLDRDSAGLSLLILPNLALMTNGQLASVRRFVERGGSLIATDETSLYNEWGDIREDYALSDLFGAHLTEPIASDIEGTKHTYLRLTPELRAQMNGPHTEQEPKVAGKRHEVLKGFEETDIFPYGGILKPHRIDRGAETLMTFIPEFPIYPPETAWMRTPKTDIAGLIVKTNSNGSRIAFMPADIDRQFGRHNLPDHGNLLENLIRWAIKDNIPLTVEGAGLVDFHLYRQANRLVLHVINLTSAATWRAPIHDLIDVGPLKVRVQLPRDVSGKNLRSLVSGATITPRVRDGWAAFEIKSVLDHEVIVIT